MQRSTVNAARTKVDVHVRYIITVVHIVVRCMHCSMKRFRVLHKCKEYTAVHVILKYSVKDGTNTCVSSLH